MSSRVSDDYVRTKLPDGSFQTETYAFGKGGYWSGVIADATIDRMDFMDVARTLAGPLTEQGYIPATDPKRTKLLIMVYWGTTEAPEHASNSLAYQNLQAVMTGATNTVGSGEAEITALLRVKAENYMRDIMNRRNAMMLGYDSWWEKTFFAQNATPLALSRQDMIDELEQNRYFVVLMAYDFQLMQNEKKHKLLWETRFSISEHRNQFDKQLAAMVLDASRYFGQDSHGLVRKQVPEGHVEVGEPRSMGVVPEK